MGVGSTEAPAPPTTTDNVGGCTDARSGPVLEEAAPPVCDGHRTQRQNSLLDKVVSMEDRAGIAMESHP
jgi:hypothetical protein